MSQQLNIFESNVLATAKPNQLYRHFNNYQNIKIEVRKVGDQIRFYETYNKREKCITRDFVKSLFRNNRHINKRPFLEKENKEFIKLLK